MASQESRVGPPKFGGTKTYERWKIELEAWRRVTKIEKASQALTVALSFDEDSDVRDKIFNEIGLDELNVDGGMQKLVQHLDGWYKEDELTGAYTAWNSFNNYRKNAGESMEAYILEFQKKSKSLTKFKIDIPNSVLAFNLLDGAALEHREKQLALTAVDYKQPSKLLDQMIAALRKFFGNQAVSSDAGNLDNASSSHAITVKSEPVYAAEEVNVTNQVRYPRGRSYQNQGGGRSGQSYQIRRRNQEDEHGNIRKCFICNSIFHYARECHRKPRGPRRVYENTAEETSKVDEKQDSSDEVFEMSCGKNTKNELRSIVGESFNCAVLDSACSSTVCGIDWMNNYLGSLSMDKLNQVVEEPTNKTFKFGDGDVVVSIKKVVFPCVMAGKERKIRTDVVNNDIPLLFGKPSIKKAKIKIDFEHDTAIIHGVKMKLNCLKTGHYYLPLTDTNFDINEVMLTVNESTDEKKKKSYKVAQTIWPSYK